MLLDPSTAITDYILTIQCSYFAFLIYKESKEKSQYIWYIVLFTSLSFSSFFCGTVHGFFLDESTIYYAIFWRLTLIAIAFTTLSCWRISASFIFNNRI